MVDLPEADEPATLHDRFAMAALTGLYAAGHGMTHTPAKLAEHAHEAADAMLEVRKQKEPTP